MKEKEKKTNLCFVSNKGSHYSEFLRHSDKKQIPSVPITLNRLTLNFPHPNSNNLIPFLFLCVLQNEKLKNKLNTGFIGCYRRMKRFFVRIADALLFRTAY